MKHYSLQKNDNLIMLIGINLKDSMILNHSIMVYIGTKK